MGGSAANFGADVALLSTTHSRRLHKLHEIVGLIEKMVMGFNFPYFPIFSIETSYLYMGKSSQFPVDVEDLQWQISHGVLDWQMGQWLGVGGVKCC